MSSILPWKQIGKVVTLAGKYGKKLVARTFVNPVTGDELEFVMYEQRPWSSVLAITEDGDVLLSREYKQGRDSIDLEPPAGTADFEGEPPEEIMRRELRQETGYEPGRVIGLGFNWLSTRNSSTKYHLFLALDCVQVGEQDLDENEQIELVRIPLHQWLEMMIDGEIDEGPAHALTLRALPYIVKGISFGKNGVEFTTAL